VQRAGSLAKAKIASEPEVLIGMRRHFSAHTQARNRGQIR
jgi:hypothetical protein